MNRTTPIFFVALAGGAGCGSADQDVEPGRETGACVDDECLGELVCLSNLCVDPEATPESGGPDSGGLDSGGPGVLGPPSSVSILVVVDNSGSMGEEQPLLAPALRTVAEELTNAGIDWRIGITTTDSGNPWCTATSPEAGNLVLSSCRSRPTEFVFDGATFIDAYDDACASHCPEEWAEITMASTPLEEGGATRPRPWIEHIDGASNLPAGLPLSDALACLVPQGIDGCGFESHLESMHRAIDRSGILGEDNQGFLPEGALLAVVIVSDEIDCSNNLDFQSIFLPRGNRMFWSDPTASAPSSAICWNAGVQCSGGACTSADYDLLGNAVAPEDAASNAVLHPVARYVDRLRELDWVLMTVIAGVQSDGTVVYDPSPTDVQYLEDFGVGPGCSSSMGQAVPPVRMRELAEAFPVGSSPNLASICDPGYERVFSDLGWAIMQRVQSP